LALLCLVTMSNYLDRTIVLVLSAPISREFGLSDLQIGLLGGPAFASLYVLAGLVIARLSEGSNRVRIISAAVFAWSLLTLLCGTAGSYVQLLAARAGVGFCEAASGPAAHSLTSDHFPPSRSFIAFSYATVIVAYWSAT
jgi:MFS transporter, Spinster family, sphingosine-1-phosphate transporter